MLKSIFQNKKLGSDTEDNSWTPPPCSDNV